jgi:hypothetical protein
VQLWLVLVGSALLLAAIAIAARVDLELDWRARGEPDGTWLAAFGAGLGPLAVAAVAASGTALRVELFCFGRRLDFWRKWRVRSRAKGPANQEERPPARPSTHTASRIDEAGKHAHFALGLHRRVHVESLVVELTYGFRDVALTGRILGAVIVLSQLLPRAIVVHQTPLWHGPERWEARGRGKIGLWVGLVLTDVLWYMLRARLRRSAEAEVPRSIAGAESSPRRK